MLLDYNNIFTEMSATSKKNSSLSASQNVSLHKIPKLPPIPKLATTKDRFDNSPLLKYRRAEVVQNTLVNKV